MAQPLFSASWYRVAGLTPKLRAHAQIHRHQYRGETWYVLQDLSSGRFHRFSPAAYFIIGLMDGKTPVQKIWDRALAQLGDDAVTQDEVIQLLGQLHAADVMQCDVPPDTAELFRRREKQEQQKTVKRALSVFAWQIPLYDPDRLLDRLLPLVRPFAGWFGFLLWCAIVGAGLATASAHWRELSENMLDRILVPENLLVMWLVFPVLKLAHELGHAFAVKTRGGEVHEMGVMIMVLTPVPYVDASSAWALRGKWQRIMIGAAGMMVELFLASIALFLWLSVEPGVFRGVLYNVILIAGISTVLFNANPLLRFDGYYILMDWLEVPNLRSRSTQYWAYLAERYLFGRREAESPLATRGERAWFVGWSVASFFYRIFIVIAILVFLGEQSLLLGVVFAAFTAATWFVVPGTKIVNYLLNSPRIRRVRRRALTASAVVALGLLAAVLVVPIPMRTTAQGVVWLPDEGFVRAGADGFVERVVVKQGRWVKSGEVLVEMSDVLLATELKVLEARVRELDAKYREQLVSDRVRAEIIGEEQRFAAQNLERARERAGELVIKAKLEGEFVYPRAPDAPGRFLKKGELLAHVVNTDAIIVRAVVSQQDIDLVRNATRGVDVRLAEHIPGSIRASVKRVVPSATDQLPTAALGTQGGGVMAVDPTDREGRKAVQRFFQVDVGLSPDSRSALRVGGRAYVRFDHGWEPLGLQWFRRARQLFLARFNV
ncbi:MAG TPA: PqqD family peptide modification chaperone [Burkholderiales bacterium]|nr:PqqD family peptide modification chaperone [Burkholderiales bacterium]